MNCPHCNGKVKGHMTFLGQDYKVRCECGARLLIAVGIFRDKIVDWYMPTEVKESPRFL